MREITLRHGCFPLNLLHIFKKPFLKNTYAPLVLINGYRFNSRIKPIKRLHDAGFGTNGPHIKQNF